MRPDRRLPNQLRPIQFTSHYTPYAEGSVLVEYGKTKVLCTATFNSGIPRFLKEQKEQTGTIQGWITAEYGMLPRATQIRTEREAMRGKQSGRTQEIQRLIGRALRSAVNLNALGENTIIVDCDVLQADGGTRTASITGGCVAVAQAITQAVQSKRITQNALMNLVASVSVGIVEGEARLDLEYVEDSTAETDMNIVMNDQKQMIEIQGTAEKKPFNDRQLNELLSLAQKGISEIIEKQRLVLKAI